MDTPFYGTQIFGSKEQVVKPHTSVTLTCKSIVLETKAIDSMQNHFSSKSITWARNDEFLTEKVREIKFYLFWVLKRKYVACV